MQWHIAAKCPCRWVGAWGSYHRGRSYALALLRSSDTCTGRCLRTPNRDLHQDTACCYCMASGLLLRGRDCECQVDQFVEKNGFWFETSVILHWPTLFFFHIHQSSCETPDRIIRIIPTKLTVESCVAWRAITSPIDVHTDTPILAKAFLCRHRKRERESACVLCERERLKAGKFAQATWKQALKLC